MPAVGQSSGIQDLKPVATSADTAAAGDIGGKVGSCLDIGVKLFEFVGRSSEKFGHQMIAEAHRPVIERTFALVPGPFAADIGIFSGQISGEFTFAN